MVAPRNNTKKTNPIAGTPMKKRSNRTRNRRRRAPVKRVGRHMVPQISAAGTAFLKCAFAPPDFGVEAVRGIPDQFTGQTLVKKHRLNVPYTFVAGQDTYLLVAGSPGIAFYQGSIATGTTWSSTGVLSALNYADYQGLFGPIGQEAQIVNKFRTVSTACEITPTVNEMTWAGSISAWRAPLALVARALTATPINLGNSIEGLEALNATLNSQYTAAFKDGLYMVATNNQVDFEFQPITPNQPALPASIVGATDFMQLVGTPGITGLANMDALIIKVSVPAGGPNMSANLRVWSCIEYQVAPNSTLYEYTSASPAYDPMALAAYRKIAMELPIAVPCAQNANFWDFVKRLLTGAKFISGLGTMLPGPYGLMAGGINTALTAFD